MLIAQQPIGAGELLQEVLGPHDRMRGTQSRDLALDTTWNPVRQAIMDREITDALAWAIEQDADATRVRIIGSDILADRYEAALAVAGITAERGDRDAAARGLWRIANRAGLLH